MKLNPLLHNVEKWPNINDSFRNCISLAVLFKEDSLEGAVLSEFVIARFVKRFKAAILSKSYW